MCRGKKRNKRNKKKETTKSANSAKDFSSDNTKTVIVGDSMVGRNVPDDIQSSQRSSSKQGKASKSASEPGQPTKIKSRSRTSKNEYNRTVESANPNNELDTKQSSSSTLSQDETQSSNDVSTSTVHGAPAPSVIMMGVPNDSRAEQSRVTIQAPKPISPKFNVQSSPSSVTESKVFSKSSHSNAVSSNQQDVIQLVKRMSTVQGGTANSTSTISARHKQPSTRVSALSTNQSTKSGATSSTAQVQKLIEQNNKNKSKMAHTPKDALLSAVDKLIAAHNKAISKSKKAKSVDSPRIKNPSSSTKTSKSTVKSSSGHSQSKSPSSLKSTKAIISSSSIADTLVKDSKLSSKSGTGSATSSKIHDKGSLKNASSVPLNGLTSAISQIQWSTPPSSAHKSDKKSSKTLKNPEKAKISGGLDTKATEHSLTRTKPSSASSKDLKATSPKSHSRKSKSNSKKSPEPSGKHSKGSKKDDPNSKPN